jgi:hypothetical protein
MWEDAWSKSTKSFVAPSIYKTSTFIPLWTMNTFHSEQGIPNYLLNFKESTFFPHYENMNHVKEFEAI